MFNIKKLFKKEDKPKYVVESNEEYLERLRKNSTIYQKLLAYIEKNKNKGFENDFIKYIKKADHIDDTIKFGLIEINSTLYTMNFMVNGCPINTDVDMILLDELERKIRDIYETFRNNEHKQELEKALAKLDVE